MRWKKSTPTPCVHVTENCQTDITSGGRSPARRLRYHLCNTTRDPASRHRVTTHDGGGNTSPPRREEPGVTFWPAAAAIRCVFAVMLGETPKSAGTSNHVARSYNHQNKLSGIRICPVTAPFNKRIRKSTESGRAATERHSKSLSQSF